jgi:hypothetical protein
MVKNSENQIVKEIFTKEEMEIIYDHINNTPDDLIHLHPHLGHKAFMVGMPERIKDKVLSLAQKYSDVPLKLTEISAARYANGYIDPPNLFPHFDFFETPRFTFDIQLKSTRNWIINVEGKPFTLRDNEAIIFSGTNQLHWRDKTLFRDDDIVVMLFCHFSEDSDTPKTNPPGFKESLLEREQGLKDLYDKDLIKEHYQNKE